MRVLVLNPGSSSLKSSVIDLDEAAASGDAVPAPLAEFGQDWGFDATLRRDPAGDIRALLSRYAEAGVPTESLEAVGYRVVHGGSRYRRPAIVDSSVVEGIRELAGLAPLHNAVAATTIGAGLTAMPGIPQVAVFDTAFHSTLPEDAFRYAVPERWYRDWGIRRYGFHGISVTWSVRRAPVLLGRPVEELRLLVAHLGSGCSVTAVDAGRSVDTSMGFTPIEGMMMGTRSGSIDPGILFYVLGGGLMTPHAIAEALDHRSGLLGVSGKTSDVRELLRLEGEGDEAAALALALFVRRAAEEIAATATSLPSIDALVFTGGIGEHAASIRTRIVERLGVVGVAPIPAADVKGDGVISAPGARPAVVQIQAREDLVVASETARLVAALQPA